MSQVDFFMLPEDEGEFLAFLFSRADTHVIPDRFFATDTPQSVRSLPDSRTVTHVSLLNATLRPAPVCSHQGAGEYDAFYTFDLYRDPCIEFVRSRFSGGVLNPGRIYAKIGWLQPEGQNRVYRSWYSAIERWLKKRYVRQRELWWFGPQAHSWSLSGGLVAYGGEPSCVLIESLREPKPV